MFRPTPAFAALTLALALAQPILSQTAVATTPATSTAVAPQSAQTSKKASQEPKFSGQVRVRGEMLDNLDFNDAIDADNDYVLTRVRLKGDLPLGEKARAQIVLQDSRNHWEDFAVAGSERRMDLQEGFVEVRDFADATGLTAKLGRQEINYGEERMVGSGGFFNVGRTYDAARLRYEHAGNWHELFLSHPAHDAFAPQEVTLWGFYNSFDLGDKRVLEPYLFRKHDPRAAVDLDLYAFGVRSKGPIEGRWDYSFEGVVERGDSGPREVEAWAYHTGLGYSLEDGRKTRFHVEHNAGSGDSNPADGVVETFDNLYPTNHYHYGFGDLFSWRNMSDLRLGFSLDVAKKVRGTFDYHQFHLQDSRDAWYRAVRPVFLPRDATGLAPDDAGEELDLMLRWAWRKDVTVELGGAHFMPGGFVRATRAAADDADYVYLMTVYNF